MNQNLDHGESFCATTKINQNTNNTKISARMTATMDRGMTNIPKAAFAVRFIASIMGLSLFLMVLEAIPRSVGLLQATYFLSLPSTPPILPRLVPNPVR